MRILIVEDDPLVAEVLRKGLANAQFAVDHVPSAELAQLALSNETFDLLIADLGLPKMSGLELVQRLRHEGNAMPILILTARDGLRDRIEGLDLGADDYLTKPFELEEVVARCRALIRRSKAAVGAVSRLGNLSMNLPGQSATLQGKALDLTSREWAVLEYLFMHANEIVTKERIIQSISSWDADISPNAVEVYVSRLRAKLEAGGLRIRTIRGLGYRLEDATA